MIRPLTVAFCMLAFGSGLYLYQSKHEVQLLDKSIEKTVRETSALRDQSRLLAAEWTMLNDFDRLRQFTDAYLPGLKPIAPAQFTSVADLGNRLPSIRTEAPAPVAPVPVADLREVLPIVAEGTSQQASEPSRVAAADEPLPIPPVPVAAPVAAPATHLAEIKAPAEHRPAAPPATSGSVIAENQPRAPVPAPRPIVLATSRPTQIFAPPAQPNRPSANAAFVPAPFVPAQARPTVAASSGMAPPPNAYGAAYGGSLLGMARGSMQTAPRPTPVSATYNTN